MPEFSAHTKAGGRGLLETHRSNAQQQTSLAAKKSLRSKQSGAFNEKYQSENYQGQIGRTETNSRRRPTLTSVAPANRSCGGVHAVSAGAMADITNVTAGRTSLAEKWKPVKAAHPCFSFQPPAAATTRDLTPAGAIAPSTQVACQEKAIAVLPDPQLVQEYGPDIMDQLFANEALALPQANYMDHQTDITGKMRMILNDWLIEVHMKYRLAAETLHLAVNLIDRYLSNKQITRKKLQLIGVAAMFIASKFEEINPPELRDWVYITDGAYTKDDVLLAECDMLQTLSFKIVVPTAAHFFDQLADANGCDAVHRSVAQYLLELGLLDTRVLQYKPSQVVAAALLLSNELFIRSAAWPEAMIQKSRHSEQMLRVCAEELRQLWKADRAGAGGQLQALHKKFSAPMHHSVAVKSF